MESHCVISFIKKLWEKRPVHSRDASGNCQCIFCLGSCSCMNCDQIFEDKKNYFLGTDPIGIDICWNCGLCLCLKCQESISKHKVFEHATCMACADS